MRIAPLGIVILCLALGLTGCSSFGKKKSDATGPASAPPGKTPAKFPSGSNDPLLQGAAQGGRPGGIQGVAHRGDDVNGILAGTVIDRSNQKPQEVFIRYVCLEDAKQAEAPIDVAVMPGGYFTIRGLQPNKQYKLIARGKTGDKVVAGVSYAKTPNIRVAIELREDFAGSNIPDVPNAPAFQPKKEQQSTPSAPEANALSGWTPLARLPAPGTQSGFTLGTPHPLTEPGPPVRVPPPPYVPPSYVPPPPRPPSAPEPSSTGWVPGIASDRGKNWPPLLEINPPKTPAIELQKPLPLPETPVPGSVPYPPPPPPRFELPHSTAPARVPSCVLIGRQLHNLALNDTSGKTWQYKSDHKGKLLLIDFWGTWCMPCRKTIPQLGDLQTRYGPQLEVVGIAYEGSGTTQEQAVRVNAVGQRLGVNYRQLLGGTNCPVQSQFAIAAYPTLVLLDETGTILWRHQGELEQSSREDLELLIQRQLGMR